MKTALYRHFDAADNLLYVGISLTPIYRLSSHVHRSNWSDQIVRVSIEWLEGRPEALAAEAQAIVEESPLHNIAGRVPSPSRTRTKAVPPAPRPPEPRYVDRPEAVAAHFNVSIRQIAQSIRNGMPREQIGLRRFRYELGAIEAWARSNTERDIMERIEKKREKARTDAALMREALTRAFTHPRQRN